MGAKQISFKVTTDEARLIGKIVSRACAMIAVEDQTSLIMDITTCHANGCKLDLQKFLAFPSFDFLHDVCGIIRHINRRTGKLLHCFDPRCSMPLGVAQVPDVALGNPFAVASMPGCITAGVEDRLYRVKQFNAPQIRAALALPNLEKTVRIACERRLRKLTKESEAAR